MEIGDTVICIDDKFDSATLLFYKEFNIKTPIEGKLYTIEQIINNTNGRKGLVLSELQNPTAPIKHEILGIVQMQINFDIRRFTKLDGTPLNIGSIKKENNVFI